LIFVLFCFVLFCFVCTVLCQCQLGQVLGNKKKVEERKNNRSWAERQSLAGEKVNCAQNVVKWRVVKRTTGRVGGGA
jgi:hypothetical protein